MEIRALKGTKDIFGDEMRKWLEMEETIRGLCDDFGFTQIRTPMFEFTNLFQRSVGDTTDVVQKEMYSFIDKGENAITLKPESTAGVARSYIEHNMGADVQPIKVYYMSPTFRYEKPQAGRQRQFHQFGVEMFGSDSPTADAEIISIGYELLKRMGINKVELHINSLGDPECRKKYNEALKAFLETKKDGLCPLCNERREKNPLRVLDCKNPACQEMFHDAPTVLDTLGEGCKAHFEKVQELLTAMGIPFVVDPKIVRGLDYYTKTVFEFVSCDIGAQGTVCGGGRYNGLIQEIGGKPTPAVGFGAGMERLILAKEAEQGNTLPPATRDLFLGYRGEEATITAYKLITELRSAGISAESDHLQRSVKAQMKFANKIGAKYSAIIGESELENQVINLKNMETGETKEVAFADLVSVMKEELAK
ncbi:histidine--tRNA ligase [Niameybacter massiliensis]|uniref:Histidine--tRNA ligase n=1 Tax=Holtiella tumoricola TaxID=3018743 RepID=A0AA42J0S5_9FIRM|nr:MULTISPECIES: histidine--tRNA ligase [Lachnospirales]MDA3731493.1 histidine--tRNA ligase [Holtiella tumoricola]